MVNQGIDFYNLSQSLAGAIFGALIQKMERPTDPPPPLLQLRRGRAEAPAWFLVQALEFDPEPISVETPATRYLRLRTNRFFIIGINGLRKMAGTG